MNLEQARKTIDEIDDAILESFIARMEICREIAEYKAQNNIPTTDSKREEEILEKTTMESGETFAPYTKELFIKLLELSKKYQEEIRRQ